MEPFCGYRVHGGHGNDYSGILTLARKELKSARSGERFAFEFTMEKQNMPRVLIVEDHRIFREAFKIGLQGHLPSVVIEEAQNGAEALQRINETHPDFIFIDIRLAEMNGLELAQRIKKDFPRIRIAMLTGYDLPEYRRAASQYGVDRFFVKDALEWKEIEEFLQYLPKDNR